MDYRFPPTLAIHVLFLSRRRSGASSAESEPCHRGRWASIAPTDRFAEIRARRGRLRRIDLQDRHTATSARAGLENARHQMLFSNPLGAPQILDSQSRESARRVT
jgi:hypothetical protein